MWQRAAGPVSSFPHVSGFPVLERAIERLTPSVLAWSAEESVTTHGDLRPGKVIWQPDSARAFIIDFDEPVQGPAALDLARAALEPVRDARMGTLMASRLPSWPPGAWRAVTFCRAPESAPW
ncbi:phosphotransferase [Deinococcus altitudinis]|uniref:phosphotransferase n=1 Tax=Deinococcus altitudinis TaxID=468914 RepID=UPI0038925427